MQSVGNEDLKEYEIKIVDPYLIKISTNFLQSQCVQKCFIMLVNKYLPLLFGKKLKECLSPLFILQLG